jgi:hypothetical protein
MSLIKNIFQNTWILNQVIQSIKQLFSLGENTWFFKSSRIFKSKSIFLRSKPWISNQEHFVIKNHFPNHHSIFPKSCTFLQRNKIKRLDKNTRGSYRIL